MQVLHIPAYYDEDMVEPGTIPSHTWLDEDEDVLPSTGQAESAPSPGKELDVDIQKEEDLPDPGASSASTTPSEDELGKRLGIHYFADEEHYNQADLDLWLPVLQSLGINWIVLPAPLDRAIPQEFIEALVAAEVQPIVHLNIPLTSDRNVEDLAPMFRAYAGWGVRYVVLFDRPNLRANWPGSAWTQRDLVQRFLVQFVPLAHAALEAGLTPVFPALEPGGDYWDTAFLRSALESLAASGEGMLLESLALGAYAWTGDRPMTWGAGGPESWPATLPYYTPDGSQDQRGFRIFDWYNAISRAVLNVELPILILAAGVQRESGKKLDAALGTRAVKMAETFLRQADPNANNAVPSNVLACNFWLISAVPDSPVADAAWFEVNGKPTKVGREWTDWRNGTADSKAVAYEGLPRRSENQPDQMIDHYLLLPAETELPFEVIYRFLQENSADVGTSHAEAAHADRVTLAGGMESFPDDLIRSLIQAGCTLDHLPLTAA